jgi:hypothetical protein
LTNRNLSPITFRLPWWKKIGSDRVHCECMRRFASFGTIHVIHCIITNFACLSGNKFTNWCPSSYLSAFSIFFNVREVNLVYPIHNESCHKQQMINNDKLNHGKPQLQLWIDSLKEMFLSRWTAHAQWNITLIINLKIVNFYKAWSNMKILMLFHDFDVIGLFSMILTIILDYKYYIYTMDLTN